MNEQRLGYLLERYLHKTCTPAEKQEFLQLLDEPGSAAALEALNEAITTLPETGMVMDGEATEATRQALLTVTRRQPAKMKAAVPLPFTGRAAVRYAAAIILLLGAAGFGWWYTMRPAKTVALSQAQRFKNEVAPGRNGAVLTLSNGRQIVLDSAGNGLLTKDGEVKLVKKDGAIAYEGADGKALYNHMATANGQQWQLTLNDGTRVWLNAASSIRYPVAFTGPEREVEITGEAYFEVAQDAARPFRVKTGGQAVEVLGTHFNINAYSDEGVIKTTLLEGKVRMGAVTLSPGEQLQVAAGGKMTVMHNADTELAVAWKNGLFQFDNADLPFVMRQLTRWYNVEVRYPARIPQRSFGGAMQRSLPLTRILAILEDNDVKFAIEGNRITVLP